MAQLIRVNVEHFEFPILLQISCWTLLHPRRHSLGGDGPLPVRPPTRQIGSGCRGKRIIALVMWTAFTFSSDCPSRSLWWMSEWASYRRLGSPRAHFAWWCMCQGCESQIRREVWIKSSVVSIVDHSLIRFWNFFAPLVPYSSSYAFFVFKVLLY